MQRAWNWWALGLAIIGGILVGLWFWPRTPHGTGPGRAVKPAISTRRPEALPVVRPSIRRLTFSGRAKFELAWSPDSRLLAYQEEANEVVPGRQRTATNLWVIETDGAGEPLLVSQDPVAAGGIAWTPDNALIMDLGRIFVVVNHLGEVVNHWYPQVPEAFAPAFSPDGRLVYFHSSLYEGGVWLKILHALDLQSGQFGEVTRQEESSRYDAAGQPSPRLSRSGKLVSFTVGRGARQATVVVDARTGKKLREIADAAAAVSWAPRGERLAYVSQEGEIVLLDFAGERVSEMRQRLAARGPVTFSPDGRRIVYAPKRQGDGSGLLIVDLAKNRLTRVDLDGLVAHAPAWSPDGRRIAFLAGPRQSVTPSTDASRGATAGSGPGPGSGPGSGAGFGPGSGSAADLYAIPAPALEAAQ